MTMIIRFLLAICGPLAVFETRSVWLLFALVAIGTLA